MEEYIYVIADTASERAFHIRQWELRKYRFITHVSGCIGLNNSTVHVVSAFFHQTQELVQQLTCRNANLIFIEDWLRK